MSYNKDYVEINGTQYKRIVKVVSGAAIWQKDIPIVPTEVHASGLHIIFVNPQNNHFDHIKCSSEWKEYLNQE